MSKVGDYDVKELIEPSTGTVRRIYTYKRKPCITRSMKSRLALQFGGYRLIEKDLRNMLLWISEIEILIAAADPPITRGKWLRPKDPRTATLIKALFVATMAIYFKCFSQGDGRPVKLARKNVVEPLRELHDECVRIRHNFAAHSGAERVESVDVVLVFPSNPHNRVAPQIVTELMQPDVLWRDKDETTIRSLVEQLHEFVVGKMHHLNQKLLEEEVYAKGREYWRKKKLSE